jgi:hypothetical protein
LQIGETHAFVCVHFACAIASFWLGLLSADFLQSEHVCGDTLWWLIRDSHAVPKGILGIGVYRRWMAAGTGSGAIFPDITIAMGDSCPWWQQGW